MANKTLLLSDLFRILYEGSNHNPRTAGYGLSIESTWVTACHFRSVGVFTVWILGPSAKMCPKPCQKNEAVQSLACAHRARPSTGLGYHGSAPQGVDCNFRNDSKTGVPSPGPFESSNCRPVFSRLACQETDFTRAKCRQPSCPQTSNVTPRMTKHTLEWTSSSRNLFSLGFA